MFIVIENTPGYLPEDDDAPVFVEYKDAVAYVQERVAELVEDPDTNVEVSWGASQDNFAACCITDLDKMHDLGRWIAVERLWEAGDDVPLGYVVYDGNGEDGPCEPALIPIV